MTENVGIIPNIHATISNANGRPSGTLAIGGQEYQLAGKDRQALYVAIVTRSQEIAAAENRPILVEINDQIRALVELVRVDELGDVRRESTVTNSFAPPAQEETIPRSSLQQPAPQTPPTFDTPAQVEPVMPTVPPQTPITQIPQPPAATFGAPEFADNQAPTTPLQAPPMDATPPAPVRSFDTATFGQRPRASQGAVVAQEGFSGALNRMSGGALKLPASRPEARRARLVEQLQAAPSATRAFINSKGGGGKTTALYCTAAILGMFTPHMILALDGNDNHGTLGDRGKRMVHDSTVRDVLTKVDEFAQQYPGVPVPMSLIAPYLHAQPEGFSILPSQSRAYDTQVLTAVELHRLYDLISPSFSHIFIDTGNNIEGDSSTSTIQVAAEVSDSYVFAMMGKIDNARNAFATMDYLTRSGFGEKVSRSVAIVNQAHTTSKEDLDEIVDFLKGRVSTHVIVPWDAELDRGRDIRIDRLAPATRHAYLDAAVAIFDPGSHQRRP